MSQFKESSIVQPCAEPPPRRTRVDPELHHAHGQAEAHDNVESACAANDTPSLTYIALSPGSPLRETLGMIRRSTSRS